MRPSIATMTDRQAAFRADYRQRISPWYSGLAHVLVIAALGIATIWYCARHRGPPDCRVCPPPHPRPELAGMAGRAGRVSRLQHLRMGDAPLFDAPAGQGLYGDLQAPYPGAPPVLHGS